MQFCQASRGGISAGASLVGASSILEFGQLLSQDIRGLGVHVQVESAVARATPGMELNALPKALIKD